MSRETPRACLQHGNGYGCSLNVGFMPTAHYLEMSEQINDVSSVPSISITSTSSGMGPTQEDSYIADSIFICIFVAYFAP